MALGSHDSAWNPSISPQSTSPKRLSSSPLSGSPTSSRQQNCQPNSQRRRSRLRNTKNLSLDIQPFRTGSLAVRKRPELTDNLDSSGLPKTAARSRFNDCDASDERLPKFTFDLTRRSQSYSGPTTSFLSSAPFNVPTARSKPLSSLSISIPMPTASLGGQDECESFSGGLNNKTISSQGNNSNSSSNNINITCNNSNMDNIINSTMTNEPSDSYSTGSSASECDNSSESTSASSSDPIDSSVFNKGSPSYYYRESESINCYPSGPILVCEPNIYLYSEPSADTASEYDVIINVAKEVKNPFNMSNGSSNNTNMISHDNNHIENTRNHPEYIFIPWDHNSKFVSDLESLTGLMMERSNQGKKVLVHCQCGVSRSASLVVAYVMKLNKWDLNTAYEYVKAKSPQISPNMTLMYQLMDWSDIIKAT